MMVAEGTNTMNGRKDRIRHIRDYQSNVSYTLHLDSGICDRAPLKSSEQTCLGRSDGAVKSSDTYFGVTGIETVNITLYRTTDNGYNTTIAVNENCIPVRETYHGKNTDGELLMGEWMFYNIRTTQIDFTSLSFPIECLTGGIGTSSASIVGKRSLVY
ncbi:uncharacterized protein LOC125666122 isoform X2 [Ostrea edulis]|nr:uncharacterized protein LOC125666122 isoform X2 [Ostrea edulis]